MFFRAGPKSHEHAGGCPFRRCACATGQCRKEVPRLRGGGEPSGRMPLCSVLKSRKTGESNYGREAVTFVCFCAYVLGCLSEYFRDICIDGRAGLFLSYLYLIQ